MLNFNEIIGASDEQLREVYSNVFFLSWIPPINPANNSDTYSTSPNLLLLAIVKTVCFK
jgi:hypothetical protein